MATANTSDVRFHQDQNLAVDTDENIQVFDQQSGFNRNRMSGLALLIILFAILWLYGWAGEITLILSTTIPVNWTSQSIYATLIIMSSLFTIVGFGMLFTYFKYSPALSFLTSLLVVSFTILISPIFSKFWFNIFVTDFNGTILSNNDPNRFFYKSFGGLNIYIDFYNLKISFANSISQLVLFLGVFGKLSLPQIIFNTFLYNFFWNLNHFLCAYLQTLGPDTRIFDDYLISNVYLFAACYALILSFILKKPASKKIFSHSNHSIVIALLGTFFVFMSFCTTTPFFPLKFTPGQSQYSRSYVWQEGFLSTFYAMSASVIFTLSFSILFGASNTVSGKIGVKELVFGTVTGGIFYGSVSGTCLNIGAAIASGLFAGLVSAFYFRYLHKKINRNSLFDSYGVINIFTLSFLSTFVLAPIFLISYFDRSWILTTFQVSNFDKVGLPIINKSIVGWILCYVGISMGIGLLSGLVSGIILYLMRSIYVSGSLNQDFFTLHYGLNPANLQIFEEDLAVTTEYERIFNILKLHNAQQKSSVDHIEILDSQKKDNRLTHSFKKLSEVTLDLSIQDETYRTIEKELTLINPRIKILKADLSLSDMQQISSVSHSTLKKFKAIYFLAKSKKLERHLTGSSMNRLKILLSERSKRGCQQKKITINSNFSSNDDGVTFLSLLKSKYEDLSVETTISS